ncbi:hypothetical protein [Massilia sp. CCM 8734]|uniref:hypothetical protein n=1 Tax=Massilia sp. CCM 8734 TaxID=2609283 RepID=UPI00141EAE15|nr:hypothetical protein [Massilia sp. CCM 8734]NHZ99088.1 hypothetical protein [Massilia sp. CCM 8734]
MDAGLDAAAHENATEVSALVLRRPDPAGAGVTKAARPRGKNDEQHSNESGSSSRPERGEPRRVRGNPAHSHRSGVAASAGHKTSATIDLKNIGEDMVLRNSLRTILNGKATNREVIVGLLEWCCAVFTLCLLIGLLWDGASINAFLIGYAGAVCTALILIVLRKQTTGRDIVNDKR